MHNLFVIDQGSLSLLKNNTLLIDTNAIIDAWRFKAESATLLNKFAELNCYIVTTRSVVIEFLGGTTDVGDMRIKLDFLEELFARPLDKLLLPLEQKMPNSNLLLEFSRQANNFSYADFELFLVLKKYGKPRTTSNK